VHADHLGTPRRITRPSDNKVMWQWESEPFGYSLPNENPQGLGVFAYNLRFPGQVYDAETGMHYNYFRDYDPGAGRYVQADPIGLEGGINTYTYVNGNPISYVDPEGLQKSKPPPIPGDLGRYPYVPDYWRRDPGKEYRDGYYASVCVETSCPIRTPPGVCTVDDPTGSGTTWKTGTFASAPGQGSPCVCRRWELEWRLGRRPPKSQLDKLNLLLEALGVGHYQ
jgi:RHS repeat-associated protein